MRAVGPVTPKTIDSLNGLFFLLCIFLLSACGIQNSPYDTGAEQSNTLFTSFDSPPKYLDPTSSYSTNETPYTYQIYEPLFGYHYLKRPYELIPLVASYIPHPVYLDADAKVLSDDAPTDRIAESVYDIPIKPGVRFQPHPAFAKNGQGEYVYHHMSRTDVANKWTMADFPETGTREMTAEDFVYAIKRLATTRVTSPIFSQLSDYIIGLKEYGELIRSEDKKLRAGLAPTNRDLPFLDFRKWPLAGAQALDEHTLRIRIKGKYPQFKYWLAMTFVVPIPWEAEKFYTQPGMAEKNLSLNFWPVGTGPYMLTEYSQNRRHVLTRNPNYRREPYPCEGEAQDEANHLLADCGKKTPFIDRVVFSPENEWAPLRIKFLQGWYDIPEVDRTERNLKLVIEAVDSKENATEYTQKKIRFPMTVETTIWFMGFNWLDPVVGHGHTPEQQEKNRKLRQAISIAVDWNEYVAIFKESQGIGAHGPLPPGLLGYKAPEESSGINPTVFDVVDGKAVRKNIAEAKKLLAEAGYPDGRNVQTGEPLVLNYDFQRELTPGFRSEMDWYIKQFAKIGIQLEIRATDYNRFQDKMRRGTEQIFFWGWNADYPDAENFLFLLYGPNAKAKFDGENPGNYQNDEFDRLFERMKFLEDGPEKGQVIARMVDIVRNDAPWMFAYFPLSAGAYHRWLGNAKPTQMVRNYVQYMKLDPVLRTHAVAEWNRSVWWPVLLICVVLALSIWPAYAGWRKREQATGRQKEMP